MAEFVEFRCEEWVPELEKLERIRLFEPKEIKSLVNRRREFEYKLERRTKCKDDFLKYIQFEVGLLKIITVRRKKTGIVLDQRQIESKQISRIIRMFKKAIFRYPEDIKLWMSLFQFCNDAKQFTVISKMLVKMLQYHANKPELWIYAADCELKNGKSTKNARQFLLKALRHHPSSDKIYLQLFKLELEHRRKKFKLKKRLAKKNKWNQDEVSENIINGKLIEIVYKSAIKEIENAEFKVELLNVASKYEGITNIQNMIFKDLVENHLNEEVTWNAIAKRIYEGFECDSSRLLGEDEVTKEENGEEGTENGAKTKIQKCIDIYERAIKKFNTSTMWNYYLSHIISIHSSDLEKSKLSVEKSTILKNALEGALSSGHISEEYLLKWIDGLKKSAKNNKYLKELLSKGTQLFPESVPLWHARIRHLLSHGNEKEGKSVFAEAVDRVAEEGPLWELMIEYCRLKNSPETETIFEKGLKKGGEVARVLKPRYLEWVAGKEGIEKAREAFRKTEFRHPPSLELYRAMIKLESEQNVCKVEEMRKCYELATSHFGKDATGLWLDFIKWEMRKGDVKNVHLIYRRALNSLIAEKADEFIEEYNFIKMDTSLVESA